MNHTTGEQRNKQSSDHDSVIQDWRQNAEQHDEENYEFLRRLKHRDYGFDPDEVAAKLHQKALQIVDCTRCANCCETMTVKLEQTDIDRIAKQLDMTAEKFVEAYLEPENENGLNNIRQQRWPFLGSDDRLHDLRCAAYSLPGVSAHEQGRIHDQNDSARQQCPEMSGCFLDRRADATSSKGIGKCHASPSAGRPTLFQAAPDADALRQSAASGCS